MSSTHDDGHRLIVVGASAGGVDAMRRLVAVLPGDLDAAIVMVLHVPDRGSSMLPQILDRVSKLNVRPATDGAPLVPGRVYVGPPGSHLLVRRDHVELSSGPTEHGHRPSIDAMFRTAADGHGAGVIGVVLSGALDDGVAGLLAISERGGLTVVQEPDDALYDAMPRSAIARVPVDIVAPVEQLARDLVRLAQHPRPAVGWTGPAGPDPVGRPLVLNEPLSPAGAPSRFTCPQCGGALWEVEQGDHLVFRCDAGHAWTDRGLLLEQDSSLEGALWAALRVLAEREDLLERLRVRAEAGGRSTSAKVFALQLRAIERNANLLRALIREAQSPDGAPPEPRLVRDTLAADEPGGVAASTVP